MKAKVKFEIIASVIQIIIGIVVIYSLIRWRIEALTSVNSLEYELWWLILITAGGIFFFNIIAFELLGFKLFPSEPEKEVKKIPKFRKISKVCYFLLICGASIVALSLVFISYILGLTTSAQLQTPNVKAIIDLIILFGYIGGIMIFIGFIMILAGALSYIEEDENLK